MAVCELAGLAGVLCRLLTQPTPAAAATMSQLARMAADMIAHPGGNAVNPSPINGVSPLCHECCTRLDYIYIPYLDQDCSSLWFSEANELTDYNQEGVTNTR